MPADKDRKALFQSTLPGWGATSRFSHRWPATRNFNPRPPRMGSDNGMGAVFNWLYLFQSTLPGGGATTSRTSSSTPSAGFQSTLPGWGATKPIQGDRQNRKDFNPRSPDGERHGDVANVTVTDVFQSTLPGWGATGRIGTWVWTIIFQSTLPGWGATQSIVNQSI